MRKLLVPVLIASLWLSAALAQTTTAPNTSNTVSPCSANTPLVGNGASVAPKCHASGALGTAAFVNTGTSGATLGLLNTANTWGATQAFAAMTATTHNGLTITTTTGTLTFANAKTVTHNTTTTFAGVDGKTLAINNSLTLAGTDSTTQTFPTTNASIARTDAAQTFTGTQTFAGAALSSSASAGVGYATGAGAGGAVTQITSRTTTVTLNAITGAITLFAATPVINTWVTFTLTNSSIAATDVIVVSVKSATNTYVAAVAAMGAGGAQISFVAIAGTPSSDSPVINFAIIKGSSN